MLLLPIHGNTLEQNNTNSRKLLFSTLLYFSPFTYLKAERVTLKYQCGWQQADDKGRRVLEGKGNIHSIHLSPQSLAQSYPQITCKPIIFSHSEGYGQV